MKRKQWIALALALVLSIALAVPALAAEVQPTTCRLLLDGKEVTLEGYTQKDATGGEASFVKLRDVAQLANGGASQFNVEWNATDIRVTTGVPYTTPNGAELTGPLPADVTYGESSVVWINGDPSPLRGFQLTDAQGCGHTYFRPEDMASLFGISLVPASQQFQTWQEAYAQLVTRLTAEMEEGGSEEELTFDLIYLNDDDVPELVAGVTDYSVSLYTFADGQVYTLADNWGYGAFGNHG